MSPWKNNDPTVKEREKERRKPLWVKCTPGVQVWPQGEEERKILNHAVFYRKVSTANSSSSHLIEQVYSLVLRNVSIGDIHLSHRVTLFTHNIIIPLSLSLSWRETTSTVTVAQNTGPQDHRRSSDLNSVQQTQDEEEQRQRLTERASSTSSSSRGDKSINRGEEKSAILNRSNLDTSKYLHWCRQRSRINFYSQPTNSIKMPNIRVFSGSSHPQLAALICERLGKLKVNYKSIFNHPCIFTVSRDTSESCSSKKIRQSRDQVSSWTGKKLSHVHQLIDI